MRDAESLSAEAASCFRCICRLDRRIQEASEGQWTTGNYQQKITQIAAYRAFIDYWVDKLAELGEEIERSTTHR